MNYAPDTLKPADTWRTQAACLTEDPELFHPRGYDGRNMPTVAAAQAICDRCPVAEQCLALALVAEGRSNGLLRHGIYGGTTPNDRLAISRGTTPRQPAKCGTRSGYKRHRREGTRPCADCRTANARYVTARIRDLDEIRDRQVAA
ncbi:WhiB family transcriptional regulator [Streptomyces sp. NPDC059015]|uniref:WhiB family transcriptional regulator n=1 Tax=unclassified Streptomyces TaxID=2593676 RepID=UPI0036B7F497